MRARATVDSVQAFLGSVHVLSSAVRQIVEDRALASITGGELSFGLFKLLRLVATAEAQTIGDVAHFLGVSSTAAGNAVDKLVRRRLLQRSELATDRRAIQLSLTDQGRRIVEAYGKARDARMAAALRDVSPARLRRAASVLERISAELLDHAASPDQLCVQCGIYFREDCLLRRLVRRRCFYLQNRKGGERPEAR